MMPVKFYNSVLIFLLLIISISQASTETLQQRFLKENHPCKKDQYRCVNLECIDLGGFCNGNRECSDGSDEASCYVGMCPDLSPMSCNEEYRKKCIPLSFVCNGRYDCPNHGDEVNCKEDIKKHLFSKHLYRAESLAKTWIHQLRRTDQPIRKWGADVRKIAVALYLSEDKAFHEDKSIRDEITNELSVGFLSRLALKKIEDISSTELASYINAFLVACIDPRKFYVVDLVKELRRRVDAQNHTLPFVMLAMCNAGEKMTESDTEKLTNFFSTAHRKYLTDMQALALLALACAARQPDGHISLVELGELSSKLKARQHSNGTFETLKTTALVMQALMATESDSNEENFNAASAIQQILLAQKQDGSFGSVIDTYSVLPTLVFKSLADIDSSHCSSFPMDDFPLNSYLHKLAFTEEEKELVHDLENQMGMKWTIQISLWIGNNRTIERTFGMKVPANISFEGLMEFEEKLSKFRFVISMRDGKPYIYSINGIQNDAEEGMYWFLFLRSTGTEEHLEPINPADVTPENNQHLVFWYKCDSWTE